MRIFGPSEQPIPDGTINPPNFYFSRAFDTGDVVTNGYASSTRDPGTSSADWDFIVREGTQSGPVVFGRNSFWTDVNVSIEYHLPSPKTLWFELVGGGAPAGTHHGTAHGVFVDLIPASVVYCQYGTQLAPPGTFVYYLTPGLIDVWLAAVAMPYLAPLFTAFWFTSFNAQDLCGTGPPVLPPINLDTLEAGSQTVFQILQNIAWHSLCQCTPGSPTPPVPFPVTTVPEPPGWPTGPTFPCDNVDPCAALVAMQKQLAALQVAVQSGLELTTLLQRYGEPFAYIPGAVHSGIASSGSFQISRLVGVRVTVTERAGTEQLFSGTPTYISDLGWISLLTGDGLIDEIRLTRDSQAWFPRLMPLALQLGISLREGVVVDVQELEAEP